MKLKTLFWLPVTGILAITLCSCSDDKNKTTSKLGDSTPPELSEKLNSFNVLPLPLDSIRAINGMTALEVDAYFLDKYGSGKSSMISEYQANDQLLRLTTKLVESQLKYTQDNLWTTSAQPNGLCYAWGHKDTRLQKADPSDGCQERLAGLDCSGLLYLGAKGAGLNIAQGKAIDQIDESNWNDWLRSAGYGFLEAKFTPITTWDERDWQNGDIIVFNAANHIGTIMKRPKGKLAIIHSQGSQQDDCETVKGVKKGPAIIGKNDNDWSALTGMLYGRLRIQLKDSYTLRMRCQNIPIWVYVYNLSININSNDTFNDEVIFVDYDGSINRQKITYSYNAATRIFTFSSRMTDNEISGYRIDEFSIPRESLDVLVRTSVQFFDGYYGCQSDVMLSSGFVYNKMPKQAIPQSNAIGKK